MPSSIELQSLKVYNGKALIESNVNRKDLTQIVKNAQKFKSTVVDAVDVATLGKFLQVEDETVKKNVKTTSEMVADMQKKTISNLMIYFENDSTLLKFSGILNEMVFKEMTEYSSLIVIQDGDRYLIGSKIGNKFIEVRSEKTFISVMAGFLGIREIQIENDSFVKNVEIYKIKETEKGIKSVHSKSVHADESMVEADKKAVEEKAVEVQLESDKQADEAAELLKALQDDESEDDEFETLPVKVKTAPVSKPEVQKSEPKIEKEQPVEKKQRKSVKASSKRSKESVTEKDAINKVTVTGNDLHVKTDSVKGAVTPAPKLDFSPTNSKSSPSWNELVEEEETFVPARLFSEVMSKFTKKMELMTQTIDEMKADNASLRAENKDLRTRVEISEGKFCELEKNYSRWRQAVDGKAADMVRECMKKTYTKQQIDERLQDYAVNTDLDAIDVELEKFEEKLEKQMSLVQSDRKDIDEVENAISDLGKSFSKHDDVIAKTNANIGEFAKILGKMKNKTNTRQGLTKEQEDTLSEIKMKTLENEERFGILSDRMQRIDNSIDQMQAVRPKAMTASTFYNMNPSISSYSADAI